jgi:hypothetical protein
MHHTNYDEEGGSVRLRTLTSAVGALAGLTVLTGG